MQSRFVDYSRCISALVYLQVEQKNPSQNVAKQERKKTLLKGICCACVYLARRLDSLKQTTKYCSPSEQQTNSQRPPDLTRFINAI